jgi:hypothetical protein
MSKKIQEDKAFLGALLGSIFGGDDDDKSSQQPQADSPSNYMMPINHLMHPTYREPKGGGDATATAKTVNTSFDSDPIQFAHYLIRNLSNVSGQ